MCKERYINLLTDFGFKKMFGTEQNKEFLISFLNSLLEEEDDIVEIHRLCKNERLAYEISLKNFRDYNNTLKTAEKRGHEEGKAEGLAEGMVKGKAEGRAERDLEIVIRMKQKGMTIEEIASLTGLSVKEIDDLLSSEDK